MQYRKLVKDGDDLSLLSYGCMRFPTKSGGRVNKELAFEQMYYAYENGVNYFDTAYIYHGGKSEVVLGEFIKKYDIRKKVYIADKLPAYLVAKPEHIEKYFKTQLERLDTDYLDYYLMHTLDSLNGWEKLKSLGILDFIDEKKKSGQIRYIGFSFHGRPEEFIKILEDYDWDFCQIQYNYIDEYYQAGLAGLKKAYERGVGVIIMEPLRGGSLAANAPDKVKSLFNKYPEKRSPAYWALRWIMNQKEVGIVLSGMNDIEHIKENIRVANETEIGCMSDDEIAVIDEVKKVYNELMKVPCTGCDYCMPCPFGVDISGTFSNYNSKYFFNSSIPRMQYLNSSIGLLSGIKSGADLCTSCMKCVKHCPQHIEIPQKLSEAHKDLDSLPLRLVLTLVSKFLNRGSKKRVNNEA